MSEKKEYRFNWGLFYPHWKHFSLRFHPYGYFDARPYLHLCLIWGEFFIYLPFLKHGKGDECDGPQYGVYYFENQFWFWWGMKKKVVSMPWCPQWVRTSILLKDGSWEHEKKGERKDFWKDEWSEKKYTEVHSYDYRLNSGMVQNRIATVTVEEREWRWRWFTWFPFFGSICRAIVVDFSDEVGERSGSWKGGCMGCGYELKKGETPEQCLRRMERERKF